MHYIRYGRESSLRSIRVVQLSKVRLAGDSTDALTRTALGTALAAAGEYDAARPILEEMWQQSTARVVRLGRFRMGDVTALYTIRRQAGD